MMRKAKEKAQDAKDMKRMCRVFTEQPLKIYSKGILPYPINARKSKVNLLRGNNFGFVRLSGLPDISCIFTWTDGIMIRLFYFFLTIG